MEEKKITEYTDLELCEMTNQFNQQLMIANQNLMALNQEIQRRKSLIKEKK